TCARQFQKPGSKVAHRNGAGQRHGADGSGQFHNELRDIIDKSTSLDQFNARVVTLRDRWQIDPSLLPELPSLR
ncbi:hypothetical protein, partial [Cognatiyoonia sp. IB215182]|uniref:hypothetical protein n=1 Tax=Cognatiyoonia sp. IB215182 TaxID=3097353 RepID=UPI002A15EC0B